MVKKNSETNKRAIWGILAILAVIGMPIGFYYILMLGIANQPGDRQPYNPRENLRATAPEWTPDGSRIVFGHEGSIYVVNKTVPR